STHGFAHDQNGSRSRAAPAASTIAKLDIMSIHLSKRRHDETTAKRVVANGAVYSIFGWIRGAEKISPNDDVRIPFFDVRFDIERHAPLHQRVPTQKDHEEWPRRQFRRIFDVIFEQEQ